MKAVIGVLSFLIIISVCVGETTISTYFNGEECSLRNVQDSEHSTNLMRFGVTNGSYEYSAAEVNALTTGQSGYSFSTRTGGTYNSSLFLQSMGAINAWNNGAVASDQTNAPSSLCEDGTLSIPNTTNSTPNSTTVSGKYPISQSADYMIGTMSNRGEETPAQYTSDVTQDGADISIKYTVDAARGYNYEDFNSEIHAGNNKNNKIMQFSQSTRHHAVGSTHQGTPLEAGGILEFTGYKYTGPDLPVGWEVEPETNATEEAVNNSTVLTYSHD